MTYTPEGRRNLLATSASEPLLELIEITHPELVVPARFVNDTQDFVLEGNTYFATRFRLNRPDDKDQQTPQARLAVDNINRQLTGWLEVSAGGKGAKCRIMAALRSDGVIQFDQKLDLTGVSADYMEVSGALGYKNTLMLPAVAMRFDPFTAPGLQ
ncbi:MAG: DUF1833 family protein [Burkholderiaceae bacterium]